MFSISWSINQSSLEDGTEMDVCFHIEAQWFLLKMGDEDEVGANHH